MSQENSIIPDLDFLKYCEIDAVNFSTLKHILRSPKAYQEALKGQLEPEEGVQEALEIGKILHSMVLESKDIRSLYAVQPLGLSLATKEGKAWKSAQTLPIITEKELSGVPKMAQSIADDPDASDILKKCDLRELTLVCDIHGVRFKCRLDGRFIDLEGNHYVVDLKSCLDAREEAFSKNIANYYYDFQCEAYCRVYESVYGVRPGYIWIAVEKRGGFDVQLYMPSDDVKASGHRKMERALNLLLTCRDTQEWPGYSKGIKTIGMPKWAKEDF